MADDLKDIVQRMIDAGESEENIGTVIAHFRQQKPVATPDQIRQERFGQVDAPADGYTGPTTFMGGFMQPIIDTTARAIEGVANPHSAADFLGLMIPGGYSGIRNMIPGMKRNLGLVADEVSQAKKWRDIPGAIFRELKQQAFEPVETTNTRAFNAKPVYEQMDALPSTPPPALDPRGGGPIASGQEVFKKPIAPAPRHVPGGGGSLNDTLIQSMDDIRATGESAPFVSGVPDITMTPAGKPGVSGARYDEMMATSPGVTPPTPPDTLLREALLSEHPTWSPKQVDAVIEQLKVPRAEFAQYGGDAMTNAQRQTPPIADPTESVYQQILQQGGKAAPVVDEVALLDELRRTFASELESGTITLDDLKAAMQMIKETPHGLE